ncbi:MAG: RluA family pseudouridine synthase [Myxococcales bacterium]|nr:RluA family pseudouridine synthase [Myxococcales bacterium]
MGAEREERRWAVGPEAAGRRLGDFLRSATAEAWSARAIKRAIERGAASVNGRAETFASRRLAPGDRVSLDVSILGDVKAPTRRLVFEAARLLHEDDALVAYDKPPGHPSAPTDGGGLCVYDVVRRRFQRDRGEGIYMVHRLDRDTSGVLLFLKTKALAPDFRRLFAEGGVRKVYRAIALGEIPWGSRTVDAPIGHLTGGGPERWGVVERGGRRALTRFERVRVLGGATDLRALPETGRTHQIRVHLASLGYPILGDVVYAGGRRGPVSVARHMLHAASIAFEHPATKAPVRIDAPLPEDFTAALAALEARDAVKR